MLPQCSHITRKRGIYYYRRRLPKIASAEVCLSLATRNFREAQHLAALLDKGFEDIVIVMDGKPDLGKSSPTICGPLERPILPRELLPSPANPSS